MGEADTQDVLWARLDAGELRRRAEAGAVVILPVASTEQHGPHLATGVDTILCGEICRRAGQRIAGTRPVVVAPTLWAGLAEHHVAFGGTFTLTLPTYHAVLRDLCLSIVRAGFDRIVIVNGHGGNMTALNALTPDLTREVGVPVAVATYWLVAEEPFRAILEDQAGVLHACEAETSMMMTAAPDLVNADRLPEAHGPTPASAGSALMQPLGRWRSFKEMTATGVLGDARRASADKGERLIEAAARALADRLVAGEPWA
jgi:creatinine amidohydrolase